MKFKISNINKFIRMLIWVILPFLFILNINLFLFVLLIQMVFIKYDAKEFEISCTVIYLFAFLYNGISVFSLRLYDWISIIMFIIILIKNKRLTIRNVLSMLMLVIILVLNLTIFNNSNALQELLRYFMSILVFINIINISFSWECMKPYLIELAFVNLYNCLIVFVFISKDMISNISNSIISSDIFLTTTELRMNGFFTDPNKYMVFCTFLLFVIYYFYNHEKNYIVKIILYISGILSFSRTSYVVYLVLVCLLIYMDILRRSDKNSKIIISLICIIVIYIFIKLDIISKLYDFITILSGRERTIAISSTVSEDSRYFIWIQSLDIIKNTFFMGNGLLSFEILLPYPTHNTFIQLILDGGIILLCSWIMFFRRIFIKKSLYLLFPLIIIPIFLLDLANYRILFVLLAFLYIERMDIDEDNSIHKVLW